MNIQDKLLDAGISDVTRYFGGADARGVATYFDALLKVLGDSIPEVIHKAVMTTPLTTNAATRIDLTELRIPALSEGRYKVEFFLRSQQPQTGRSYRLETEWTTEGSLTGSAEGFFYENGGVRRIENGVNEGGVTLQEANEPNLIEVHWYVVVDEGSETEPFDMAFLMAAADTDPLDQVTVLEGSSLYIQRLN